MKSFKHILIALSAAFLVTACGGGSPEATVKNFQKAIENVDFEAAKKYCTKESAAMLDLAKGFLTEDQLAEMKTKDTKTEILGSKISEDGQTATVTIRTTDKNGKAKEEDVTLKKEDGEWKIAILKK